MSMDKLVIEKGSYSAPISSPNPRPVYAPYPVSAAPVEVRVPKKEMHMQAGVVSVSVSSDKDLKDSH